MPIKWTPEIDSILLHAVFEECNISFSKALCKKIATRIDAAGIECTPKAVENRLYSWKKKNVGSATASSSSTATTTTTTTTSRSTPSSIVRKTAKAPPRTPKSSGKKMKNDVVTPGHELEDDDEEMWADSPSVRKRRCESGDDGKVEKKVKMEDVEEEWA